MQLAPLFEGKLRLARLGSLDQNAGGPLYETVEGEVRGERLQGTLRLTNLGPQRPEDASGRRLRGRLTTDDGAQAEVELNALGALRASDSAPIFATSLSFHTSDPRYAWLNTFLGVVEGVFDPLAAGGVARIRAYRCQPTI